MPYLPGGANASILANFPSSQILAWIDGAEIPEHGPHARIITQYGCTVNRDFEVQSNRSIFRKGMTGSWIEEKNGQVKIYIRGVTEYWYRPGKDAQQIWVLNQWVPSSHVDKG